ncbi:MAG: hypothetical protein R2710_17260 [Acidimicrobiales bacterium]
MSVPEWRGGRSPAEQIVLISAAAVDLGDDRPATRASWVGEPWPGQLPKPSPTKVFEEPDPVEVVDRLGRPVMVNGRGEASGSRPWSRSAGVRHAVEAWAGPWPMEDRWWDPANQRRRARFQVVLAEAGATSPRRRASAVVAPRPATTEWSKPARMTRTPRGTHDERRHRHRH